MTHPQIAVTMRPLIVTLPREMTDEETGDWLDEHYPDWSEWGFVLA